MDTTVDPCDDCYQYSCGGWIKNFTLPADKQVYDYSFNHITKQNEIVIQDIVKQDWPLLGEYDSCMALDTLSAMGNAPLRMALTRIEAVSTKTDLARVAGELGSIGPSLLTSLSVGPDPYDAMLNVLSVIPAALVLPSKDYYSSQQFPEIEAPFRKYISTILTLAGIDLSAYNQQGQLRHGGSAPIRIKCAQDVVITIEKKMSKILPTNAETEGYHSIKYIRNDSGFKVVFDSLDFMDRAEKLFKSLKLKELKVYYAFLYVHANALNLGKPFVQANFDFRYGEKASPPTREKVCSGALITLFPDLTGMYYSLKTFDSDRKQNANSMITAIEKAMREHITWLDKSTRQGAAKKLNKVSNQIGHSTTKRRYPFKFTRDNYFTNVQVNRTQQFKESLAQIHKPVDQSVWEISAASANAYYSPQENQMVFPAGAFQPPLYNSRSHPVQNFGAIGAVIGHELTHGFDNDGREYDGDGNQRDWWTKASTVEFGKCANCMKKQYSQFKVYNDRGNFAYVDGDPYDW